MPLFKTTGKCKNLIKICVINDFKNIQEVGSKKTKPIPCKTTIYRCRFTGASTENDFCLYDGCKICEIKEPKEILKIH